MKKLLTWGLLFAFTAGVFATPVAAQDEKKGDPEARFKRLDKDGDGKLTLEEFKGNRTGEKAEQAEKQFKRIDKDGDSKLTLDEYKAGQRKKKDQ